MGVFFHLAAIMALWVYILPLAKQAGLPEGTAGIAISTGLAAEIAAGMIAGMLAAKLNPMLALLGSIAASLLAIALLSIAKTPPIFIFGVAIFGFFWMFAMPFQMPWLIGIDTTRKAAMQMLTAQLLGLAAGPAMASLGVAQQGASSALLISALLYMTTAAIFGGTSLRRPVANPA
jgi:MFS transporter, DHA1 family, inner membrane transport protein